MEFTKFLEILETNRRLEEDLLELSDIGFDFFDGKYKLIKYIDHIIYVSLNSHYDEEGIEWVYWFIYDSEYGQKDWGGEKSYGAFDKDNNPICYSYESLWNYLEKNHKLKK